MRAHPDLGCDEILHLDEIRVENAAIIKLAGELDASTADRLNASAAHADEPERLTLDVSSLSFLDCAGLRSILSIAKLRRARGKEVEVTNPAPPVQRLFDLVGFDHTPGVRLVCRAA